MCVGTTDDVYVIDNTNADWNLRIYENFIAHIDSSMSLHALYSGGDSIFCSYYCNLCLMLVGMSWSLQISGCQIYTGALQVPTPFTCDIVLIIDTAELTFIYSDILYKIIPTI